MQPLQWQQPYPLFRQGSRDVHIAQVGLLKSGFMHALAGSLDLVAKSPNKMNAKLDGDDGHTHG